MLTGLILVNIHTKGFLILALSLLAFLISESFSFAYRNRGKHHEAKWDGTTVNRILSWELPVTGIMTAIAMLYGFPWWNGLICGLLGYIGVSIGHGFAQSNTPKQYAEMGLVNFTRLSLLMLPLQIQNIIHPPIDHLFWYAVLSSFFLFWGAAALSYQPVFQAKTLRLFGIDWCVPGDSSWEEYLQGKVYGYIFSIFVIHAIIISMHR